MKQTAAFILLTVLLTQCTKEKIKTNSLSSLTIVNAITNGTAARPANNSTTIAVNGATSYSVMSGNSNIYVYPVADSARPYYNHTISTVPGGIYSLYLGGTTSAVDAVLMKDTIPYRTDSSFGVRFINMSPGSPALSVNLSGKPNGSEVPSLPYKSISDFKSYPARIRISSDSTYAFQIRNVGTGVVVGSYTISNTAGSASTIPRFQNVTIVLRGVAGGSPAFGITRVNNF